MYISTDADDGFAESGKTKCVGYDGVNDNGIFWNADEEKLLLPGSPIAVFRVKK